MESTQKLFHKDFTLVVIGQIISLFGNAIVRFALPLYLLKLTGSAALFGTASALSFLPMIVLTPIGGMIADRSNKRNIMVILDFTTSALLLLFTLLSGGSNLIPLLIVTLMLLYGIQGVYQPAVQASIPALAKGDKLLSANAVINQVSSLSGLLGPIIGGILYGFWGIHMILYVSMICFFISAVLELFITIPFTKATSKEPFFRMIKNDFLESITFIQKERPVIWKTIGIVALFNLFLTSMLIVALPVIITQTLGMSERLYGYSQGALAAGGLLGGIMTGMLSSKLKIQKCHLLLFITSLGLVPVGISLTLGAAPMVSYLLITICSFLAMMAATMFSIQILCFVQGETPVHLIGKVISWVLAISMCSQPVGQAMYGGLLEKFGGHIGLIMLAVSLIAGLIALLSKQVFGSMATNNGQTTATEA